MNINGTFIVSICIFLSFFTGIFGESIKPRWDQLTFHYAKDLTEYLRQLPEPESEITIEDLNRVNGEVTYLMKTREMSELDLTLIPAYLAVAQKEFAWLSFLTSGSFKGDLGPVTLWILQLFHPDVTLPSLKESAFDVYTSSIAALVVKNATERLAAEKQQIKNYPIKEGEPYWTPTGRGYIGLESGSVKTWFLKSSSEFLVGKPPQNEAFWKEQALKTKEEQKNLDGKKTQSIYEWAGMTSPTAGSWDAILKSYFKEKKVPLADQLYIQSILQPALEDANAAAFHAKYTYWIRRPSQVDPSIKPLIIIPNHPSYPSAHSTIGGAASQVLAHFFPEDARKWEELADQAGMSRIYAGIHFPVDHEAGLKLGKQVGQAVVQRAMATGDKRGGR